MNTYKINVGALAPNFFKNGKMDGNPPCDKCTAACCKAGYLGKLMPSEAGDFEADGNGHLKTNSNGECIYLKGNQCSIQTSKPAMCAEFDCRVPDFYGVVNAELRGKPVPVVDATASDSELRLLAIHKTTLKKVKKRVAKGDFYKLAAEYITARINLAQKNINSGVRR